MSFPRAKNKRFNEEVGCGPGVGYYDPKFQSTAVPGNPGSFPKGERFQNEFKDPSQVLGATPYSSLKKSAKTKSASNISDMPWSAKKQLQFTAHTTGKEIEQQKTEAMSALERAETNLKEVQEQFKIVVQNKDSDLEKAESDLKNLQEKLDGIVQTKDSTLKELANEKKKFQELEEAFVQEVKLKSSVIMDLNASTTELSSLQSRFDALTKVTDNLTSELEKKSSKLQEVEGKLDSECFDLRNCLAAEVRANKVALTELDASKLELSDLKTKYSALIRMKDNLELDLEIKVRELELIIKNLKSEVVSLKDSCSSDEALKISAIAEVNHLKLEFAELNTLFTEIANDKDTVSLELNTKCSQLTELESEMISLNNTLLSENAMKEKTLTELSDLNIRHSALVEVNGNMILALSNKSNDLEKLQVDIASLNTALVSTENVKETILSELEVLKTELCDLKSKHAVITSKLDTKSQALEAFRLDLEAKELQYQEMERNFNSLQMTIALLKAKSQSEEMEIQALTVDLANAEGVLKSNSNIILNLEAKDKENVELQAANIKEMRYLNEQVEQKSLEVDRLDLEANQNREQFEHILKEKTTELHDTKMSLEAVHISNDSLNLEIENRTQQLNDLKACLESVNSRNKVLKTDLQQQDQEIQELRQQWTEASNSVQMLCLEKQVLEEKCETMRINIIFNEDSIQTLSAELRSKEDDITSLEANRVRTELATSELTYELEYAKKQFDKLCTEKETFLNQLQEKELLVEELETRGLESEAEVELLQKELQGKDTQLQSLESKWTNSNSSLSNMEEELKAKDKRLANLQQTLNRTQQCLQDSLSETASAGRHLQSLEERFAQTNTSLELLKLELANKDAQVEAVMSSLQDLEQTHQDFKANTRTQEDQFRAQGLLESDLTEQLNSWKGKYEELEAKVAPFKELLEKYSIERENLVHENEEAYKEISDLSLKHAELMGHQNHRQKIQYVIKLKQEIVDLKKENSRLRAQHVAKPEIPKKPECLKADSKKALVKNTETKKTPLKSTENTVFF